MIGGQQKQWFVHIILLGKLAFIVDSTKRSSSPLSDNAVSMMIEVLYIIIIKISLELQKLQTIQRPRAGSSKGKELRQPVGFRNAMADKQNSLWTKPWGLQHTVAQTLNFPGIVLGHNSKVICIMGSSKSTQNWQRNSDLEISGMAMWWCVINDDRSAQISDLVASSRSLTSNPPPVNSR